MLEYKVVAINKTSGFANGKIVGVGEIVEAKLKEYASKGYRLTTTFESGVNGLYDRLLIHLVFEKYNHDAVEEGTAEEEGCE